MSDDVIERITAYLAVGGLFNPELANHDAVRDLLIDARADIAAVTAERDRMREALEEIQNPIEAMQKRATAENAKINGIMANSLAENANYLRGIARAAIEGVKEL